ncbi:glucose PTS transporter subunit IIA [Pediococcus acidilactici]
MWITQKVFHKYSTVRFGFLPLRFELFHAEDSAEEVPGNVENAVASKLQTVSLSSVVKGDLVQLAEVGDAAFSTGAMGKGIGIKPIDDHIHAPIDGKVTAIFPTKHAIGITGSNGIEILIHIGIDTVELEGKYFALQVKEGETVSQGDVLAVVDFSKVVEAGYDPTVMVIITNTNDFLDVIPSVNQIVTDKDQMLNVVLG